MADKKTPDEGAAYVPRHTERHAPAEEPVNQLQARMEALEARVRALEACQEDLHDRLTRVSARARRDEVLGE